MLCQNCGKNNATSHIHSVINGVVKDKYLCDECAAKENTGALGENDLFKMLSSFLNDGVMPKTAGKRCECCSATFDEIRRTGRVGCGNCYKTFEKELSPTLLRIHGRTLHVGKRPGAAPECQTSDAGNQETSKEQRIKSLKEQLAQAIEHEEYEKAAVLRDEIKREEE